MKTENEIEGRYREWYTKMANLGFDAKVWELFKGFGDLRFQEGKIAGMEEAARGIDRIMQNS